MPYSLFKPKRKDKKTGKSKEGRYWWGQYRLDEDVEYTRFSLRTTDKRVAQQRLDEVVKREELLRAGILAPEAMTQAASKPLREHLADFVAYLRGCNRAAGYTRKIEERVSRLMNECDWKRVRDVTAESFLSWRQKQLEPPNAPAASTLNGYRAAICGLLSWLKGMRRIDHNPIEEVRCVDGRGRKTFERRALTDAEAERLVRASDRRRPIYLTALHTGLRKGELRELRWSDIDFDGGIIRLRAETTKAKRADALPLTQAAAWELRRLREHANGRARVFRGMPSHHTFQADLERAGIERLDEHGRKVDFHALRVTFITNLQRGGVPQRTAMALARHTDARLTNHVYTDTNALPLVGAVAVLPSYGLGDDAHIDAQGDAQTVVSQCPAWR